MTMRKQSPFHDKWHRRVEGQIRDCIHGHPSWFVGIPEQQRVHFVNSLAKRIVGEIFADYGWQENGNAMSRKCGTTSGTNGVGTMPFDAGGMTSNCVASKPNLHTQP